MSTDGNGFEDCEAGATIGAVAPAAAVAEVGLVVLVEPTAAVVASKGAVEAGLVCMKIEVRTFPPALALRIWPRRTGGRMAEGKR